VKTEFSCKFCGSKDLYVVPVGPHPAKLMCRDCGKYQKFLGPDELESFNKERKA
jgi:transcription elongation factor Elf1